MTYAVHGLTALSSPSAAKSIYDQFVIYVLFFIFVLIVLLMFWTTGMKFNNQITEVAF